MAGRCPHSHQIPSIESKAGNAVADAFLDARGRGVNGLRQLLQCRALFGAHVGKKVIYGFPPWPDVAFHKSQPEDKRWRHKIETRNPGPNDVSRTRLREGAATGTGPRPKERTVIASVNGSSPHVGG